MGATRQIIEEVMCWAEAHLDQALSVEVLARRAGYSLSHFSRLFAVVAGESPARWLIGRRVKMAAERLLANREHVLDVAFACGFRDVTTFPRAFRRRTGLSPTAFRRLHSTEAARRSPPVRAGGVVPSAAFHLCGLMADVSADPAAPGMLWRTLFQMLDEAGVPIAGREFRQVAFWRGDPEVRYTCIAGFVGAEGDDLPLPFVSLDIPSCTCRCFVVDGKAECLAGAYDEIYSALLPGSGDRAAGDFVLERPRRDGGEGVEIWLPIAAASVSGRLEPSAPAHS
jgi:AraC-like DNA-binding protein/predicted transcriptional regulator YdeE